MLELYAAETLAEPDVEDAGGLRAYHREHLEALMESANARVALPEDESTAADATFVEVEIGRDTVRSLREKFAITLAAQEFVDMIALGDAYAKAAYEASHAIEPENGRLTDAQRIAHASIAVSIAISRTLDGIVLSAFEDFADECRKRGERKEPPPEPWEGDSEAWKRI